eukprot:symbB.v1.2.030772.t1/scaffold3505.1/size55173/4
MFHLLNVADYAGFGIFTVLLVLMAIPQLATQVAQRIRQWVMPIFTPVVAYAFCRWQWFLNKTSSLLKESPQCEDKVSYYRNLRDTYLTFLLMFSGIMVIWVSWSSKGAGDFDDQS